MNTGWFSTKSIAETADFSRQIAEYIFWQTQMYKGTHPTNYMIETERLILRHWGEEDAEALFRHASDPAVGPVAGWAPHGSADYSREVIRTVFASPEIFAIVLKATGEPIGCCGLVMADDEPEAATHIDEAEIGYWMAKTHWGKGMMPEAVNALLDRAFNHLNLKPYMVLYTMGTPDRNGYWRNAASHTTIRRHQPYPHSATFERSTTSASPAPSGNP